MKIKKFNEMFENKFDYDRIIRILRKTYGWGMGVISSIDEFEQNPEYFQSPQDDDQYIELFNIFLTDKNMNRLRGEFRNNHSLRLGKWKLGIQVDRPTSIYNKLL
jgi:hypothetical protein